MPSIDQPVRALKGGFKKVVTAGTPLTLVANSTPCAWVIVTANSGNTGDVVVGGSDVKAEAAARNGYPLAKGASSQPIPVNDVKALSVDAVNSNDQVSFIYAPTE
jgi:hypothetical protein